MSSLAAHPHPDSYPRAALVTGAAHRIGRAIAIDLASRGWAVAVHYRNSEAEAKALAAEISATGGLSVAVDANLENESEVETLLARATKALGPIGCLINNASCFSYDSIKTADRQSWDAHLEPNLRAPLVLIKAFADALSAPSGGAVINMIDQRVWNLTPHFLSYTVSKSGLWTLTRSLALALAPRIRVNAIGPGPVLPSQRQSQAQFDRQCAMMPLGRGAEPRDICQAVDFLLNARSVTGQMIAVDSGQHLGWAQPGHTDPSFE